MGICVWQKEGVEGFYHPYMRPGSKSTFNKADRDGHTMTGVFWDIGNFHYSPEIQVQINM